METFRMKKTAILTFCLIIFIAYTSFAQRERIENLPNFDKKTWNFGYYLGVNKNSFLIDYKNSNFPDATITVKEGLGFNIGVMVERRLHKNISIRFEPGLMSNVKKITFNNRFLPSQQEKDTKREVSGTYFHAPILLKFSTNRYRNIKPYVIGGIALDYNFSSNEDNPDDNVAGEFRMTRVNYMYEIGIGIDLYLPYFKFSPSLRGIFAINNELIEDDAGVASPWTAPIDRFGTRGVFLKFTFE